MSVLKLVKQSAEITGVTEDSRAVIPGCAFVAINGTRSDGHDWAEMAVAQGARVIVGERDTTRMAGVPYVRVEDSRAALASLANELAGEPSRHLRVFAATGTCGKTTSTYLLEAILRSHALNVGVIGTQAIRFMGSSTKATHTTPSSSELFAVLAAMRDSGCSDVVMEVSSHALAQKRTQGLLVDFALFTNLTTEHLDLHGSMESYFHAKALLFSEYALQARALGKNHRSVIHIKDQWGMRLADLAKRDGNTEVICFGLTGGDLHADLECTPEGIRGQIDKVKINSHLVGQFNAENILGAVAVAVAAGVPVAAIENGIAHFESVPGRLERVPDEDIHVFVDFAHKPGALMAVLQALQSVKALGGRLICVFGCGGDRDRAKRPEMAAVAETLADIVIVTSDNPRTEDPSAIFQQILSGFSNPSAAVLLSDRREAIRAAVRTARKGDVVLVAGKGAEAVQIVAHPSRNGTVIQLPFDDRHVLAEELAALRSVIR